MPLMVYRAIDMVEPMPDCCGLYRVIAGALLFVAIAAGAAAGQHLEPLSIYHAGRAVSLEPSDVVRLTGRFREFFYQCHTLQAVLGSEWPQDEIRSVWESQKQGSYALLREVGPRDAPFPDLRDQEFTILFGLDPEAGAGSVVTEHSGVLTLYSKCPGLDGMALTCELLQQVSTEDSWPVCRSVERISSKLEQLRGESPR